MRARCALPRRARVLFENAKAAPARRIGETGGFVSRSEFDLRDFLKEDYSHEKHDICLQTHSDVGPVKRPIGQ